MDERARDACATIQGYIYQFDATILALCSLSGSESLEIEGIEDFDVIASDVTQLFQCKYYEASRLTPAILRDAILPMLEGFLKLSQPDRSSRRFHLYGYFKDSNPGDSHPSLEELKTALIRQEKVADDPKKRRKKISLQAELGASDEELMLFARQLTIHVSGKADEHRTNTVTALQQALNVSRTEAEQYLYPTARTVVSSVACQRDRSKRHITRAEFLGQIAPSRALFDHWALREQGEQTYCASMRREHFSSRNIDSAQRVFVVEATLLDADTEILALCHTLRHKWSSHAVRRKPDAERYAPILWVRGLGEERLVALKTLLSRDNVQFVDGYPFRGATFSVDALLAQQTNANQLSLRIIAAQEELEKALSAIKTERVVYDFYFTGPTKAQSDCRWIAMPVRSLSSIERIV